MKYLKKLEHKSKCWWCGSGDLSAEHKMKKTDLEMLYGSVYQKGISINHIKYKTESVGKNLQSSNSDRVKFEQNLCKSCNGSKSQKFDLAYQMLIEYYYQNRKEIKESRKIDLEKVFGKSWSEEYLNVEKYIGKHMGCRLAEIGFEPTKNLISYLNGFEDNYDLKIFFQIKPYYLETTDETIDSIFMGPANLINSSFFKIKDFATSLSGWYTIANFTWNYLHEHRISKGRKINRILEIDLVDYSGLEGVFFQLNKENVIRDWSNILDKFEFYPYENGNRSLEHYRYIKNYE